MGKAPNADTRVSRRDPRWQLSLEIPGYSEEYLRQYRPGIFPLQLRPAEVAISRVVARALRISAPDAAAPRLGVLRMMLDHNEAELERGGGVGLRNGSLHPY